MAMRSLAFSRLSEAFGPPGCSTARLEIWSLARPAPQSPVSVILVAAADSVEVWVFDPHDVRGGYGHHPVGEEAEVDRIIAGIRGRLAHDPAPAAALHRG